MSKSEQQQTRVILFTSPHCPHCPTVKKIFEQQLANRPEFEFQLFDISKDQSQAEKYQIRSVPWFMIGDFEFQGLHTSSEIEYWINHCHEDQAVYKYVSDELNAGHLPLVEKLITQHPQWLGLIIPLLADMQAPMQSRIGLGALLEGLEEQSILELILPALIQYSQHRDANIRGDACHYLSLIHSEQSRQVLQQCLNDTNEDVREIARESLADLAEQQGS